MNQKVAALLRSKWTIPVIGSAVSFGVGTAVGYFIAKRQVEEETVEITVEEDFQLTLVFDEEEKTPWTSDQIREYAEANGAKFVIAEDDYTEIVEEGGEESMINVFTSTDQDWDYELECLNRDPQFPYTIHRDEFFADEMGWDSQSTLTYYAEDKMLVDERDEPLHNPDHIVGQLQFGHGSGDPNIVYIRNERLQAEYEVLRDPGSYEIDVLGGQVEAQLLRDDLKHSRSPGKFPRE